MTIPPTAFYQNQLLTFKTKSYEREKETHPGNRSESHRSRPDGLHHRNHHYELYGQRTTVLLTPTLSTKLPAMNQRGVFYATLLGEVGGGVAVAVGQDVGVGFLTKSE